MGTYLASSHLKFDLAYTSVYPVQQGKNCNWHPNDTVVPGVTTTADGATTWVHGNVSMLYQKH
eukprot:15364742-Ditylum_brightwellii.AAC.1